MAYYRTKKTYINEFGEDDWRRIIFGVGFALATWLGYFLVITLDSSKSKTKPPKWL